MYTGAFRIKTEGTGELAHFYASVQQSMDGRVEYDGQEGCDPASRPSEDTQQGLSG